MEVLPLGQKKRSCVVARLAGQKAPFPKASPSRGERKTAPLAPPLISFKMISVTQGRYQGSEIRDDPTKTQIPQKCVLFLEEFPFPCLLFLCQRVLAACRLWSLCASAWVWGLTHFLWLLLGPRNNSKLPSFVS